MFRRTDAVSADISNKIIPAVVTVLFSFRFHLMRNLFSVYKGLQRVFWRNMVIMVIIERAVPGTPRPGMDMNDAIVEES